MIDNARAEARTERSDDLRSQIQLFAEVVVYQPRPSHTDLNLNLSSRSPAHAAWPASKGTQEPAEHLVQVAKVLDRQR